VGGEFSAAPALLSWWRQPDHFDWFTGYLRGRGMLRITRYLIVAMTVSLAGVATPLMFSPAGPQADMFRLAAWLAIAGLVPCAALWMMRWPSRRESILFVLVVNLCIAVFCGVQSNPLIGLVGATTFAVTGGYIACFHTAGYMVYNFAAASYVAGLEARAYASTGDPWLALTALILVLLLNIALPSGIQAVVHALGGDVLRSDRDPLTRLLNRRAFFDRVHAALRSPPPGHNHLAVIMIDLDNFKGLNDTFGHATGDQALVAVGEVLQTTSRPGALAGRIGGEEFLIADFRSESAANAVAQRLCEAIAELPYPITASVGVAFSRFDRLAAEGHIELVHDLCRQSDTAMYAAKRNGGNQVCQGSAEPG